MFNNDFMLRQSRYFAERLENESSSLGDQIDLAFQLAFNRPPTADERSAAQALVERLGLLHFCRALLNANEFVYVD